MSRETFRSLAPSTAPAVMKLTADIDVDASPLAAYAALTGHDEDRATYSFLLESAEKIASTDPGDAFQRTDDSTDRHARFSFVGYDPDAVVTVDPDDTDVTFLRDVSYRDLVTTTDGDVFDRLRAILPDLDRVGFNAHDRQHLDGGLVGFVSYEAVYDVALDEVGVDRPDSVLPDATFVLTTRTLAFDHATGTVSLVFTPIVHQRDDPDAVYDDLEVEVDRVEARLSSAVVPEPGGFVKTGETAGGREVYEDAVRAAKRAVTDGDVYQCVLSRARTLTGALDPLDLYASLRDVNPSPYMYLLGYDDVGIVGASPETLVSVRGDTVNSNPIAGTCDRGTGPVEDRRLAGEMLADEKERAEHTMLVDLARNDVRRVAEAGSVRVEEFMNVLKYSHVQHIESTVTGTLAVDCDAFDAIRAAFPAGTLSGAPKIRAMERIHDLETSPRGLYGGGVGYISWDGDADFAIVIRTATVDRGDVDTVTVRAGAGIVADSDPAAEFDETERKMDAVVEALARIETTEIPT